VYYLTDVLSESIEHAIISDSASTIVNDLKITGGRIVCDSTFWDINAATDIKNLGIDGVSIAATTFAFTADAWCRLTDNYFGLGITITGSDGDSDLVAVGNTIEGDFFVNGTFGNLIYLNQANVSDTATATNRLGLNQSLRTTDRPTFAGADFTSGPLYIQRETSTNLGDSSASINTSNKGVAQCVYNTTTNRPMWATGAGATDWWVYAEGVDGTQIQPS
ncbi:MAG: hypothetical protein AAFR21_19065, partial [Pseudomonadota bacterium]